MLSFWSSPVRNVSSRREFLRVGGMGLAGLSLSEMLAMKANAWTSRSPLKDKSVIFVFMHGDHRNTRPLIRRWASSSIRSATGDTKTTLPGVQFGGTFTKLLSALIFSTLFARLSRGTATTISSQLWEP